MAEGTVVDVEVEIHTECAAIEAQGVHDLAVEKIHTVEPMSKIGSASGTTSASWVIGSLDCVSRST